MPIRTLTSTRPYSLLRGTSADEYVLGYGVTLAGEYPEENPRGANSNDVLYGGVVMTPFTAAVVVTSFMVMPVMTPCAEGRAQTF